MQFSKSKDLGKIPRLIDLICAKMMQEKRLWNADEGRGKKSYLSAQRRMRRLPRPGVPLPF